MNSSTPKLRWEQLEIPGLMEQLPKVSDSNKDKSAETQNKQVPQNKTILNPPSEFHEAVGELAEGQAPHSKAWDERLS